MTRSAEELNQKLTASEQQCNDLHAQVAVLKHQLLETMGCAEEFMDMPCKSLEARLKDQIHRAELRTGVNKERYDPNDASFKLPAPEDRENGLEVLAFHRGKWTHVRWAASHGQFILGYGGPFIQEADRAFAPLPPKPEGADGFYDWK